jgi:hypothetical protein
MYGTFFPLEAFLSQILMVLLVVRISDLGVRKNAMKNLY